MKNRHSRFRWTGVDSNKIYLLVIEQKVELNVPVLLSFEPQRLLKYVLSDMCAFAQSDQNLHCAHFEYPRMQMFFMRKTKTLIRCSGRFKSAIGAHVHSNFY